MRAAHSRAKDVLAKWDPSKVEGRSQGGKHGASTGTRKGPIPNWTYADLRPYWDLPPRKRRAACMAKTGMSSSRFDQLRPGMDDFLIRMREQEQVFAERERAQGNLLDPS